MKKLQNSWRKFEIQSNWFLPHPSGVYVRAHNPFYHLLFWKMWNFVHKFGNISEIFENNLSDILGNFFINFELSQKNLETFLEKFVLSLWNLVGRSRQKCFLFLSSRRFRVRAHHPIPLTLPSEFWGFLEKFAKH